MGLQYNDNHSELSFQYMRLGDKAETLIEFLLRKFRYHDRETWTDFIMEKRLLVDGRGAIPEQKLKNGQIVRYLRPDFMEPPVDDFFEVLYEDDVLIALNKSGDLPTSPSGKYFKHTLVHLVKSRFNWTELYPLHRLDRETSGIVLFAKTQEIAQVMAAQFREHRVQKKYTAILERPLPFAQVFVSAPLGTATDSQIRIKQGVIPGGKPSQTLFRALPSIRGYGKVEASPRTGRTHQIRVHLAYLGYPILGDKLYGLKNDGFLEWLERGDEFLIAQNLPTRQLLHASELVVTHPLTQKKLVIQAQDQLLLQHIPAL